MIFRINALAAIAFACLSCTAPAVAQERIPVTARVTVSDLNLAKPADVEKLHGRIRREAMIACNSDIPGLAGVSDAARCRREMIGDGTRQVAARTSNVVQVAMGR